MRIVLQRVSSAEVCVNGERVAAISSGVLLLVGIEPSDCEQTARRAAERIAKLRVFEDQAQKMNLSLLQVGGAVLLVSQFTLAASLQKGNRPSFHTAAPPEQAAALCEALVAALRERGLEVSSGRFGSSMQVGLVNDGPVTLVIEQA